mmetsp:Transcript_33643/g.56528  ORF Transcript_33643/g.56528 Transcript_33643/m.56528 type:complete len:289 (-) Transcript_33643:350-1216(-)
MGIMPLSAVSASRLAFVSTLTLAVLYTDQLDAFISSVYAYLKSCWWFRHDTFEPALSLACFAVYLPLWYCADCVAPLSAYLKSYRIQNSEDMSHWKPQGHISQEFFVYLLPLVFMDVFYPRRGEKLLDTTISFWWLMAEVFATLVVYDLYFFASHVLIHRVPWLFKHVHAKHHRRTVMRARETVALSIPDQALDVLCSIAALNTIKCHPLSRTLYDIVIIAMLCELHSGYDFPWMPQNVVPFGVMAGSRRHTHHHQYGTAYYQKFFVYLDNACGYDRVNPSLAAKKLL